MGACGYLATGGAGFIGSHVVEALSARAGTRRSCSTRADPGADVRDPAAVARAVAGVDAVCHQAAMVGLGVGFGDAAEYVSRNDLGTAVLLAAMAEAGYGIWCWPGRWWCTGRGRYVPQPTGSYGRGRGRSPIWTRGGSSRGARCAARRFARGWSARTPGPSAQRVRHDQARAGNLAAAWARSTGGSAVSLRYHNVFGPRMPRDTPYAGVASFFRSALARGEAPRVFEDGRQRRDFVHVRDVAAANAVALEAGPSRGCSPRTTPAAVSRTPSGRWPARWPTPTAGPRR